MAITNMTGFVLRFYDGTQGGARYLSYTFPAGSVIPNQQLGWGSIVTQLSGPNAIRDAKPQGIALSGRG